MQDDSFIEQLHCSTPTETVAAIQAMVAIGTAAIAPLIAALSHPHPSVPTAAALGLVQLAPLSVKPLISTFQASVDQGLQAYIIQALAQIGDRRAFDLLAEVVGVAVANHCQGNVRRVAARGLGRIGSISSDLQIIHRVVEKLTWALLTPEDWALRYAAGVSLQEIATPEAMLALQQALSKEPDKVVQARIRTALEHLTKEGRGSRGSRRG